jgi:hypothetical protein
VEGTDSESCPMAGFDTSDAELMGSTGWNKQYMLTTE